VAREGIARLEVALPVLADDRLQRGGEQMSRVIVGVDPHKKGVTIEVVDQQGTVLATGRFDTTGEGHRLMLKSVGIVNRPCLPRAATGHDRRLLPRWRRGRSCRGTPGRGGSGNSSWHRRREGSTRVAPRAVPLDHPCRTVFNRDEYIRRNTAGVTEWRSQTLGLTDISTVGEVAVLLTAVTDVVAATEAEDATSRMPVTQVWVRSRGQWHCLTAHAGPPLG